MAFSSDYSHGDMISIPYAGVLRHYGIVTARGSVISNSRRHGGVVEQDFHVFANGKPVQRHRSRSNLHPFQIEARARRGLGADYHLFRSNCTHHVHMSHGHEPSTLQKGAVAVGLVGKLALVATRNALRRR